jgi:hypothetical protein
MALDPNISLGVRQIELANPLVQYGQIAQIQNAQNQNALAQFQLGSAQRQEETQNALADAYQKSINPETGQFDPKLLISNVARSKAASMLPDIQSKLLESESKRATLGKTVQETKAGEFKLAQDKLKHGWMSMGDASTPQAAIEKLQDGVKQGYFDETTANAEAQKIVSMTPEQYKQYRIQKVVGLLDAKDQLSAMLPKNVRQEAGGKILTIQDNPMLPGYGQPITGMDIAKTATIGEQTAQGQLGLARQKFAWEQANPGYELKEAEDGSIVGVNKRTLQAFPVSIGGAAPTAPAAGAGMPGARLPAPAVQAIPGMTSVLDQQAPTTASTVGKPLMGKGQNLTESQSNATAYGMRMKEANAILDTMAKQGTLRGANIEAVPLVGEGLGKLLPSVLGGTSGAQQQVNQAKSNFITAVLRKESGAVISDSEFDREDKKYFPQVNDNPAVIKQKENARKLAIKAMEIQAGPGAKNIQQLQPRAGGGVDTSNPLLR